MSKACDCVKVDRDGSAHGGRGVPAHRPLRDVSSSPCSSRQVAISALPLWTPGTAMPTTTSPKGATRPALPRELSRIKQASSSAAVAETTWPAHHQLQRRTCSATGGRNSAPAVTSPLSLVLAVCAPAPRHMSEAAPDCSPPAMADAGSAHRMPAVDGLATAAHLVETLPCAARAAAQPRQRRAPRRGRGGGDSECATGDRGAPSSPTRRRPRQRRDDGRRRGRAAPLARVL